MKSLSSTLLAAQQAVTLDALVKITLTFGESSYTYDITRIRDVKVSENGNLQSCDVELNNSDGVLTSLDLKGYKGVLSLGAVTGVGDEYCAQPPMWVIAQRFDSTPGKLVCRLSLVGICNLLEDDKASETYQPDDTDTKTVKTLINEVVGATMTCFNLCTAYQIEWDSEDSLIDSYQPKDDFRVYTGNNRMSAINRLLAYTNCVIRAEADEKLHVFVPTTTGISYDYEYSLASGHAFFGKAVRNRLVIPNYIKVQSRDDDDPYYSGTAEDSASFGRLPKYEFHQKRLDSNAQAEDIAEAILGKALMWAEAGSAEVPMNVGAEAYDYVKVTDQRQEDSRVGNLGTFTHRYTAGKNVWTTTFTFGNWQNVRKALANLGITSDDLEQYFARLSVKHLYAENILAENMGFIWIDPDNTIDLSKIGDTLDNLPDGENYARVKTLHLSAEGGIKLDEHILYNPGYDASEKRRTFTATPTTPYDVGDIWMDADTVKRCLVARASGAYVAGDWTATTLDAIGEGAVFQRVKSAALSAEGLILLDQVVVGTYGLVKTTDISAGHIKLATVIEDSSHRSVSDSETGYWSGKPDDMDDIGEGTTYQRVRATDLSSGHLKLTSAVVVSGEWYDVSGVEIDAAHGINIYGDGALTTRASKGGTLQCKVGADGNIIAGAGKIKLGSSGLKVYGEGIYIYDSGSNYRGWIGGNSSGLQITSLSGSDDIILQSAQFITLSAAKGVVVPFGTSSPSSPAIGTLMRKSSADPNKGELMYYTDTGGGAQWYRCDLISIGASW